MRGGSGFDEVRDRPGRLRVRCWCELADDELLAPPPAVVPAAAAAAAVLLLFASADLVHLSIWACISRILASSRAVYACRSEVFLLREAALQRKISKTTGREEAKRSADVGATVEPEKSH